MYKLVANFTFFRVKMLIGVIFSFKKKREAYNFIFRVAVIFKYILK